MDISFHNVEYPMLITTVDFLRLNFDKIFECSGSNCRWAGTVQKLLMKPMAVRAARFLNKNYNEHSALSRTKGKTENTSKILRLLRIPEMVISWPLHSCISCWSDNSESVLFLNLSNMRFKMNPDFNRFSSLVPVINVCQCDATYSNLPPGINISRAHSGILITHTFNEKNYRKIFSKEILHFHLRFIQSVFHIKCFINVFHLFNCTNWCAGILFNIFK